MFVRSWISVVEMLLAAATLLATVRALLTVGIYTSEASLPLLSVDFFAERFPAHESDYRVEVSLGEVSIISCA